MPRKRVGGSWGMQHSATAAVLASRATVRSWRLHGTIGQVIGFVPMNPISRGLVERPEQWKWSSAAFYLECGEPPLIPDPIRPEWIV